ncbi:MAG: hypothetical protein ACJ78W_06485 [Myxococcales bacterium]
MHVDSASEARLYRRCSFAALAILLGSIAGERVFNAEETAACELRRPALEWNVTLPARTHTFRLFDHFITVVPRLGHRSR